MILNVAHRWTGIRWPCVHNYMNITRVIYGPVLKSKGQRSRSQCHIMLRQEMRHLTNKWVAKRPSDDVEISWPLNATYRELAQLKGQLFLAAVIIRHCTCYKSIRTIIIMSIMWTVTLTFGILKTGPWLTRIIGNLHVNSGLCRPFHSCARCRH